MGADEWDEHYRGGDLPWDTGEADPQLVEFLRTRDISSGHALDVGCGTGANAVWLAEQGFEVLGVDVAPTAIELARERSAGSQGRCRFEVLDFLADEVPGAFDFVFDRGCFHVFDAPDERARFAARVADCLTAGGFWLSLLGSTEGPPRDFGPPRRSVRDIAAAIEPALQIVELRAITFNDLPSPADAWLCVARPRSTPAQPSTTRTLGGS